VSGDAGITGNNQDPINWGPPSLQFSSSILGLSDGQYSKSTTRTNAPSVEAFWNRGRHNVQFGGGVRRNAVNLQSQQDPRGNFLFNGYATGSDFGDFLLGLPRTSSLAFGNADKRFRAFSYYGFFTDDLRLGPSFTIQLGMRWEYEAPMTDAFGRLVNLDVTPDFSAVAPVLGESPVGPLTNRRYEDSLLRTDKLGFQPRTAIAWRPVPGSSLVVRAGYGIYRNTNVYQPLAQLLSQQPPISRSFSVETNPANPLTLANGFSVVPTTALNTFAIDPNFRVGFSQNWQASVQRDLPMSLTVVTTYLGTKGHRLMQEFLPNTYPLGAVNPCPSCPVGFVYLTSSGKSTRHAGQVQLRRRLRNGLTAQVQYTLAKANDDATAFSGASLGGSAIAQDWRNLDAEWGPSNFDQRHLVTAGFQYTTGVGVAGGTLVDGVRGTLLKNWTVTSQVTTGSGMPATPIYLTSVPGTGVTGTVRPQLTGEPLDADGYYVNPLAFAVAAPGTWGNAGRNSIRGPSQFNMDAGLTRTFLMGDRLQVDWRIDGRNILNRVTFSGINSTVGSSQFGLAARANQMRKLTTTIRLRF
jgi:trimeric autotransporter adhesin